MSATPAAGSPGRRSTYQNSTALALSESVHSAAHTKRHDAGRRNPRSPVREPAAHAAASSGDLEQTGRSHAAADAHRRHDIFHAAPLAFDQRMTYETRA